MKDRNEKRGREGEREERIVVCCAKAEKEGKVFSVRLTGQLLQSLVVDVMPERRPWIESSGSRRGMSEREESGSGAGSLIESCPGPAESGSSSRRRECESGSG